ncbi:MAG: hypothetical protein JST86_09445 [Bacteroidetes bacterium]|nr:hypothetical protein [Bacteroidota bacterium]
MNTETTLIIIPQEAWAGVMAAQQEILQEIKELKSKQPETVLADYITAKEFMDAVKIKRTKFDKLVQSNKIKIIKKRRKIYLLASEVKRYFSDINIP